MTNYYDIFHKADFQEKLFSFESLFLIPAVFFSAIVSRRAERKYLLFIAMDRLYAIIKLM